MRKRGGKRKKGGGGREGGGKGREGGRKSFLISHFGEHVIF